jgi:endoglucanase
LLYCDWTKRDSMLVTQKEFTDDLISNYSIMEKFDIKKQDAHFFLPPYEWYNDTIAAWTKRAGLQLINYTPGTKSHADYTKPAMKNYTGTTEIMNSILQYKNLNGFILLLHIGTDPARTDKFYYKLPLLVSELKRRGYSFVRIDQLLH